MEEPLRHRQTKGAATDMFYLTPPRHISTLPNRAVLTARQSLPVFPDKRTISEPVGMSHPDSCTVEDSDSLSLRRRGRAAPVARSGRVDCVQVESVSTDVFGLPVFSQNDNILPSWRWSVKTITALAANKLGKFLAKDFRRVFGPAHDDIAERLGSLARSTIECLARSDALYHNFEHTLQVTMVGRDILHGMTLSQRIEPTDYSHLIVACLLHDIGYMRGVLSGDTETEFVVDESGKRITLPRGASDAALAPYHVDRSKLFAFERLGNSPTIDASRVAAAIEMTRFPARLDRTSANEGIEPKLVQAADLIGQLGDPMYSRKANALYSEFEEIGMNRQLGYSSPADIIDKYPAFFWNSVSTHIEDGIKYLNMTVSGRQWIANLHHHILCAEHAHRFMGPQR